MSILGPESPSTSKAEIEKVFDELENEELIKAELEQEEQERTAKEQEESEQASVIQEHMGISLDGPERGYVLGAFQKLRAAERMELPQLAAVMRGRMKKNHSGQLHATLRALTTFLESMGL